MYSALKVEGKPLYRLARKGVTVDRKEREVHIFAIQIEAVDLPLVRFTVSCSRGTYVRTLAKDIGRRMGCGAHLIQLRRVQSGLFSIEKAMIWEKVKTLGERAGDLEDCLIPLEDALPEIPEVVGDQRLIEKVRLGQEALVRDLPPQLLSGFNRGHWVKMTSPGEGFVAILQSEAKGREFGQTDSESVVFRPLRVFQPPSKQDRVS